MTLEVAKIVWAFIYSHWHHILGVMAFFLASYERARSVLAKRAVPTFPTVMSASAPAPPLPAPSVSNPAAAKKNRSKTNKHKKSKH